MEDLTIVIAGTLIGTIVGVLVGYFLSFVADWYKQNRLIDRYSRVFYYELNDLKRELDKVIADYDKLNNLTRDEIGLTKEQFVQNPNFDPEKFLLRWSFRYKYTFLRENFEKVSLFDSDTIKSIIFIYSLLEEFEDYKLQSIEDLTKTNKTLEKMGMGSAELLLIDNLRKAQSEIPKTLSLLNTLKETNKSREIAVISNKFQGKTQENNDEIMDEIRELLLDRKKEREISNNILLTVSIFAAYIGWVALSLVYIQSLSAIEFTITQIPNQTLLSQPEIQIQGNNLVQVMNFQYPILALGGIFMILSCYMIFKGVQIVINRNR